MSDSDSNDALFSRVCDGLASADEIAELHRVIAKDTAMLDAWLRYSALHGELAGGTVKKLGIRAGDTVYHRLFNNAE